MTLYDEVINDPTSKGYAAHLPSSPGIVADLLNARTEMKVQSRMVTARAIIAECADGPAILDALTAVSANNSAVKWAIKFLQQEAGIDVGHPKTQEMLDQLAAATAITAAQAVELKNMALQPASRAEVLGIGPVSVYDLIDAGVVK